MIRRFALVAVISLLALRPAFAQNITPDAVKKTKQATVYFKVTDSKGRTGEGSGFLAVESGIVVTNAHVLGMTSPNSKAPRKIEVVIHSGEPNEIQTTGKVLGVDRVADLAVVRLENKDLPAPLQLNLTDELYETQKVYIFGFPFGAELGKNITVSESSISSLRKNAAGALSSIQVNGGMHPGNSGGPVVNAKGEIVGVSVSGIKSTQINFAIPASSVDSLLSGGIQEAKPGELFRDGEEVRVPVAYKTLDPFQRIKEVRVEVWAGKPEKSRSYSLVKAESKASDGPRKSHVLQNAGGDVPLPKLADGQVAWVQPILVYEKGKETWGAPQAFDAALAIDREPAELHFKLAEQKERTVHLKTSQSVSLSRGKSKFFASDGAEVDMLEVFDPHQLGARVRTAFGQPILTMEESGRKATPQPLVVNTLQRMPPIFVVDDTNKLRERVDVNLGPNTSPLAREQINDYYRQICNAYEATNFVIPNKTLKPRDVWDVRLPLLLKLREKGEVVDLVLQCTYEGARMREGTAQALVRVAGKVQGRNAATAKMDGQVDGKFTYDVKRKFVSSVQLKISQESADDDVQSLFAFDIDLTRREGNSLRLELPKERSAPPAKGGGDLLVNLNAALNPGDPLDANLGAKGSRAKTVPAQMAAGKTYVITLNSSAFDCYLRLHDPAGNLVAEDDDSGGGLNSRIEYVARTTGQFKIVATSFDGKMGPFELRVTGEKVAAAVETPAKKTPNVIPNPGGAFTKPAKSAAATGYLKIASPPGDYIGQGKNYDYAADQLTVKKTARGVQVGVDGWSLAVSAPQGQFLQTIEYQGAKRNAFSGNSPGLDFSGKGRGNNRLAGEFVVWELEMNGDQIVRLAIDFVQRSEERGPPLRGKLRVNSTLE